MLASELIKELEENIKKHGDCHIGIEINSLYHDMLGRCFDHNWIFLDVGDYNDKKYFIISGENL